MTPEFQSRKIFSIFMGNKGHQIHVWLGLARRGVMADEHICLLKSVTCLFSKHIWNHIITLPDTPIRIIL